MKYLPVLHCINVNSVQLYVWEALCLKTLVYTAQSTRTEIKFTMLGDEYEA